MKSAVLFFFFFQFFSVFIYSLERITAVSRYWWTEMRVPDPELASDVGHSGRVFSLPGALMWKHLGKKKNSHVFTTLV